MMMIHFTENLTLKQILHELIVLNLGGKNIPPKAITISDVNLFSPWNVPELWALVLEGRF